MELKVLFENNSTCPYTGRKLTIGLNASLDHIVPTGKKGTHSLSNLQWVYFAPDRGFDVNRMKGHMTDAEFRAAIKEMCEHTAP